MQLEDINIKFGEESEKPDNENQEIHHINAINLEEIEICPVCGYFVVPKTKNYRTISHYCEGPDGVKRIYHINLCSQRYECTNPKQIHTSTAGMLDHKSPYTPEFRKHVITLFL